jgi:hypothetical protein
MIDEWWDPQLEGTISWLGRTLQPDVAIVNYTWLSKALECLPRETFKVLDTHDKFSGRKELLAGYGIMPEFFYTTELEEKIAFARSDMVWAIKEEERVLFTAMTDRPVVAVPHAEPAQPLPARSFDGEDEDFELRIGLIGAKNSINVKNTMRFLDVAGPMFRNYLPPLKIVIGGTICDLLEDLDLPYVEKLGWVANTEDFYKEIDVALVPMEFSTGLKIKVSEAMTFRRPIVSHEHAFEGYTPFHDYHSLTSFEEIAEACMDLAFKGRGALPELENATKSCHRSVTKALEAGVAKTGEAVSKNTACTLVCVTKNSFMRGSLAEQTSTSALLYLSYRSPVAVYVDDLDDFDDMLRFCKNLKVHKIYVNARLQESLSAQQVFEAEYAGLRWATFEGILESMRVRHVWLDHIPDDTRLSFETSFEQVYLNLAYLDETLEHETLLDRLTPLMGTFTRLKFLSLNDTPVASMLRSKLGAESISILPFWGKEFPLMWDMTPLDAESRWGITVILPTASKEVLRIIEQVAITAGQPSINLIVTDDTRRTVEYSNINGFDYRHVPPAAVGKLTTDLLRSVSMTINLAPESAFATTLVSILKNSGQTVLTPFDDNGSETPKALGLMQMITMIHKTIKEPPPPANLGDLFFTLAEYDPGWCSVWTDY